MKTLDKTQMGLTEAIDYIENKLTSGVYFFRVKTAFGTILVREETETFDIFHPVQVKQVNNQSEDYHVQIGITFNPAVQHIRVVEAMQRVIMARIMPDINLQQEIADTLTIAYMALVESKGYPEQDVCDELLSQAGIMAKIDPMVQAITERYVSSTIDAAMRYGAEASKNAIKYGKLRGIPESDHPYYTMMLFGVIELMKPGTIKPIHKPAKAVAIYQSETVICYK